MHQSIGWLKEYQIVQARNKILKHKVQEENFEELDKENEFNNQTNVIEQIYIDKNETNEKNIATQKLKTHKINEVMEI